MSNGDIQTEDNINWEKLLKPSKVIRDPVHGDIWLSELETKIVDQPFFQRLRKIKQLGSVYLVYPSAHHTRFEHSIGALFIAKRIIEATDRNYRYREKIVDEESTQKMKVEIKELTLRDKVLIRMTALLHDVAHIPFGHALEKDGNLFDETQWADKDRFNHFFNNDISELIKNALLDVKLDSTGIDKFIEELGDSLKAIEGADPKFKEEVIPDGAIDNLEKPYVGDIVGNTVCADLLDYIKRDSYFTGLELSYDPRIIQNFALIKDLDSNSDKKRLALLLFKKAKIRNDMITSVFNLLDLRYRLAESVYYHPANTALSAMLIDIIFSVKKGKFLFKNDEDFFDLTDESLLKKIEDVWSDDPGGKNKDGKQNIGESKNNLGNADYYDYKKRAKNIFKKYNKREMYKPVYMIKYRSNGTDNSEIESLINTFREPEKRMEFQKNLESIAKLDSGSIILYVSKKDEGKDLKTKVLWSDGTIKPLEDITFETIPSFKELLTKKHESLWRLYVFMDKDIISEKGEAIAGYCKYKLFERNDILDSKFQKAMQVDEVDLFIRSYHPDDKISEKDKLKIGIEFKKEKDESIGNQTDKEILERLWNQIDEKAVGDSTSNQYITPNGEPVSG